MPKPGPRSTYKYSNEFKATAVRLSELPGVEVQDVGASLYIRPFMLSRWRKEARESTIVTEDVQNSRDDAAELKELRKIKRKYERLQLEHDILKNAIEFTSRQKVTSSPSSTRTRKSSPGCDVQILQCEPRWLLCLARSSAQSQSHRRSGLACPGQMCFPSQSTNLWQPASARGFVQARCDGRTHLARAQTCHPN